MKKFFICLICGLICLTGALGISFVAQPTEATATTASAEAINKITVCGSGEVRLVPDVAVVNLGVETLNESLTTAQQENSDKINNLISTLKDLGISEENIKTKNFYIYQRYDYTKGETFIGYQVSNYLEFKTKDVDNVGDLVTKLLDSGANRFNGITFTLEDYDTAYNQALTKALENAKTKASAMTNAEIVSSEIVEEGCMSVMCRESYALSDAVSKNSTFMKGEIVVKANVKVVFEY